jgi:hypothetical protein
MHVTPHQTLDRIDSFSQCRMPSELALDFEHLAGIELFPATYENATALLVPAIVPFSSRTGRAYRVAPLSFWRCRLVAS